MANTCTSEFRKEIHKSFVLPTMQTTPSYSMTTIQNQTSSTTAMRPRSLYTAHNYHPQPEDPNFQVCLWFRLSIRLYLMYPYFETL